MTLVRWKRFHLGPTPRRKKGQGTSGRVEPPAVPRIADFLSVVDCICDCVLIVHAYGVQYGGGLGEVRKSAVGTIAQSKLNPVGAE